MIGTFFAVIRGKGLHPGGEGSQERLHGGTDLVRRLPGYLLEYR